MNKRTIAQFAGVIATTTSLLGQALPPGPVNQNGPAFREGELLIKFKPTITDADINDVFTKGELQMVKHLKTRPMERNRQMGITQVKTKKGVAEAIAALKDHPGVEVVQPNWIYKHQATAEGYTFNDPFYADGSLWGMLGGASSPFSSGADQAWAAGFVGSDTVYIGVIDEGIQFDHPDLKANIWINPDEIAGDGIDQDGRSTDTVRYVDDIHGWNALSGNGNIYDPTNDDHGTHVAGTIGAVGGNFIGVAGVNWKVGVISGKFLGPNDGTTIDAIEAIDYMTHLKVDKGMNIVALNNSWGGGGYDYALLDSIVRAAKANILFVAASGNGDFMGRAINNDTNPHYPSSYDTRDLAGYDSIISVTAIDVNGNKASFGNYGATSVDIGAPGVDIISTFPGGAYDRMSGTSMATPHVAGAIALYAATHPGATPQEIKAALFASATPTSSLQGLTTTGKRLDVWAFINNPTAPTQPQNAPAAPTLAEGAELATAVSSSEIKLTWQDNAADESGYIVERLADDGANWVTIATLGPNQTTFVNGGLKPETAYLYHIKAFNAAGASAPLEGGAITLVAPPPAIGTFVAKDALTKGSWYGKYGNNGYDVFFSGAVYPAYAQLIEPTKSDWAWASSTTDTRGLQKPTNLADRIGACWYSPTAFTLDLNISGDVTRRVSFYFVDWEAAGRVQTIEIVDPANEGTVLAKQSISSFRDGQYLSFDILGRVLVRITRNAGNNAVLSGIFLDSTPQAPAAATGVSAVVNSSAQINLSWTDNAFNETNYKVERSVNGGAFTEIASLAANTRSYSNTGLSSQTTYSYRVKAVNAAGAATSETVSAVTPIAAPAAPSTLSGKAASKTQINLNWRDNSGNEAGFEVYRSSDGGKTFRLLPIGNSGSPTVSTNITAFSDTGLVGNTSYTYRVRAVNAGGASAYAGPTSVKTSAR